MQFEPADIARVCHEANRAVQTVLGEDVNPGWDDADAHLRASAEDGVVAALGGSTPEESHENWSRFKRADGWVYGPTKDFEKKTHPCLVPYRDLPPEQKVKDSLFLSIVHVLAGRPSSRDTAEVYKDVGNQWRWRRRAANGLIVSDSSEAYASQSGAIQAAGRNNPLIRVQVDEDSRER